jgi:hypothetical protein
MLYVTLRAARRRAKTGSSSSSLEDDDDEEDEPKIGKEKTIIQFCHLQINRL